MFNLLICAVLLIGMTAGMFIAPFMKGDFTQNFFDVTLATSAALFAIFVMIFLLMMAV